MVPFSILVLMCPWETRIGEANSSLQSSSVGHTPWSENRTFLMLTEGLRALCSTGNANCGLFLLGFFSIPTSFGGGGARTACSMLSPVDSGTPALWPEVTMDFLVGGHTDTTLEESLPSSSAVSTTKQGALL